MPIQIKLDTIRVHSTQRVPVQLQTIFTYFTPLELVLLLALAGLLLFYLYRKYKNNRLERSITDTKMPAVKKSFENYRDAIMLFSAQGKLLFFNRA